MSDQSKAVFISYASEDGDAAQRIADALKSAGVEVWFDRSELRGGEAWDHTIRQRIRDCRLFVAIISANTEQRLEGYFRREWKLAADRMDDMASRVAFLLPVLIDGTPESVAEVPDRFRQLHWTHLPGGEATPAFVARVSALLSGEASGAGPVRPAPAPPPTVVVRRPRVALAAAVVLTLIAAGALLVVPRYLHRSAVASAAPEKSLAVLPFVDLSEKHDQEYFADGLAEELIDLLGRSSGLKVISRTSSFSFKGRSEDIPTIAAKLNVANVLEGSVRRAGDRLRVTTQLVAAANGQRLWSQTYDRDIKDVFAVQDEIAGAVAVALKAQLAGAAPASARGTSNAEAYDQLLLCRQFMRRRVTEGYRRAVEECGHAVALDPAYGAAYGELALAQATLGDQSGDRALLEQSFATADKAVALAPQDAEAYAGRGAVRLFRFDWSGARADFTRALELAPENGEVLSQYGLLLLALGHYGESMAQLKKALEIDPLSPDAWTFMGYDHLALKDLDACTAALRRALDLAPQSAWAGYGIGMSLLLQRRFADALAQGESIVEPTLALAIRAAAEFSLGHEARSRALLEELIREHADSGAYQVAEVYAWRGEHEAALQWLERARRQLDGGLQFVKFEPLVDSLRGDPRFAEFLSRMNLAD
ncbi:MAG: TIR domain-containing protein [Proteobacteria bacterium]|nr:TIR domain-containing protein [Pseudomonadota bacterium]